ncbi:MAG: TIGR03086 family metal-binding protein [Micrococcales bacterium]|nr:TIGR03086 family metal-binding protein [Micrococcales bacterium]MCL2667170.1 TIGR03086 family metal-binding protein [Micrococcales bacterium]
MNADLDPRDDLRATLDWVGALVAGTRPDQLDASTPCTEWTVRDLLSHIVAVLDRVRVIGAGADPFSVPDELDHPPADWAVEFRTRAAALWPVWDDTTLTSIVTVPWSQMPGAAALGTYVMEFLVHGWDLADATGQDAEAPADVATRALAAAQQHIPASSRQAPMPFGPVQSTVADAGPTRRLAAWLGRP